MLTQNQQPFNYDQGMKELIDINDVMSKAHKGLSSISSYLIALGSYNQILSVELPKIYDKTSVFKGVIMQFSDVFARLDIILRNAGEKVKLYENSFTEWSKKFEIAKKVKSNHDTIKKKYVHYEDKIAKLRKKHEECTLKNKQESTKDISRLQRNEIKYTNSQKQYKSCLEESAKKINEIYIHRLEHLHNFVIGYMSTYKEMSAKLDDKLSEIHNPKTSFDKCKQEILRIRQDDRIKKAIDQDLVLLDKAIDLEKKKSNPPPLPDIPVRRKSLKLEMNQDLQKQSSQNNNQQENNYNYDYNNNDAYNNNFNVNDQNNNNNYNYTYDNNSNNNNNNNYQDNNNAVNNVEEPQVLYGAEYLTNIPELTNTNLQKQSSSNQYNENLQQSSNNNNNNNNYYSNYQTNKRFTETNAHPNPQYFSQRPSLASNQMSTNSSNYQYYNQQPSLAQKQRSANDYSQSNQNSQGGYQYNAENRNNYNINQGMNSQNLQSHANSGQYNYSQSLSSQKMRQQSNSQINYQYNNNIASPYRQNAAQPPQLSQNKKETNPFDDLLDDD